MAGPKSSRNKKSSTMRVQDAMPSSVQFHVSSETQSNPQGARKAEYAHPRKILPERPSTSGGFSTRKVVDKRQSRDDLYFNSPPAHQVGATYYDSPLPSIPTSTTALRALPLRDYTLEPSESEYIEPDAQMEIGMALGSPSHPPIGWKSHVQLGMPIGHGPPESFEPVIEWNISSPPSKQKPSRWKMFGGFFGRKPSTTTFYQVQPTAREADYVPFPLPAPGRERANSEKKLKSHKANVKRSNAVALNSNFQEASSGIGSHSPPPEIRLDGGPLLNVEIPTTQMERYSVMFGSVLKPNATTSALLARRQATLDRLKTVNEIIAESEREEAEAKSNLLRPRRATSPQPTKLPAFSLFPVAQARDRSPQIPKVPLHRSNTSPAALSPNRQTFERPQPQHYETQTESTTPSSMLRTVRLSSPWSSKVSRIPDSPCSETSTEDVHDPAVPRPDLVEPVWEMVGQAVAVPGLVTSVPLPSHIPRKQSTTSVNTTDSQTLFQPPRKQSTTSINTTDSQTLFQPPRKQSTTSINTTDSQTLFQPPRKQSTTSINTTDSQTLFQPPRKQSTTSINTTDSQTLSQPPRIRSTSVKATDLQALLHAPRRPSDALLPGAKSLLQGSDEELINIAANASIARQISVSINQQQLLVPIKPRTTNAVTTASTNAAVNGERLLVSERKPMTPTLVNVMAGKAVKSERAVFERA